MNGISAFIKGGPDSSLVPSATWRYQGESVTQKRALTHPCWHPDLRLPASGTVTNFVVYKLPRQRYFVMATQTD